MKTVLETVKSVALQLQAAGVSFGHGTHHAFDEAAWLVLWSLRLPLDALDERAHLSLSEAQLQEIDRLLKTRIDTRKPLAYLTQQAWLQGVSFYVDERVIVPRSYIAELLTDFNEQGSLDYFLSENTVNVLDLCTGNGSLAILAAMAYPDTRVQASDISADALAVAQINIQRHQLDHRIALLQSDGLRQCHGIAGQPYDLILCNPPYVNSASMAALPAEYRAEPEIALAGGIDGMDFIAPMLRDAPSRMSDHAVLLLEVGHERAQFEHAFPHLPAIWLETSAGHDQVLLLTKQALLAQHIAGNETK